MSRLLAFLPPWVPIAVIGALVLALATAAWAWGNAREEAGTAKMAAAVNAASVKVLTEQAERNQAIADKLEQLTGQRAQTIKETIREVYIQPSSDACRKSAAMRALDGKLKRPQ